ncbi:MAG TPA: hypothetical protein GX513_09495 [Firmicutes bacterium]|nr:hypothetical protein [Bacillota bacterium]
MKYRYGVLGAGRQGCAAAYDLGRFGEAKAVFIGDRDAEAAERAAARVNRLLGRQVASARAVDAADAAQVRTFLQGIDSLVSAVPYYYNLDIAREAIQARTCMCDLGGNTDLVLKELELDGEAEQAGISIVPDCGQVPGMGTSLAVYAMSLLDRADEVYMWDGGLMQDPRPPWEYVLTFNVAGLTNEYFGKAIFIREGEVVEVPTFTEYEEVDFPPLGTLEAFTTAGGTSTAPYTFRGKLRTYQNKTLRYRGHYQRFKTLLETGLLDEEPVEVDGTRVVPRQLLHILLDAILRPQPDDRDLVAIRLRCTGEKEGRPAEVGLELLDYYDETTGFTAMERTTGWHAAIMAMAAARGVTPRGAKPVELALSGPYFAEEMRRRGFRLREWLTIHRHW